MATRAALQKRIQQLEPGMVLARTVYSSDGCPLLQEGQELGEREIQRLEQWRKRYVYVWPKEQAEEKRLQKAS
ncbi:MAG: hypothetical protein ACLFN5_02375 [bacterium]